MNFLSRSVRIVVILSIVLQATSALAANNDPFRQGRSAVPVKQNAQVGQSTGAMVFTYPFVIPPGRNGMQPDLTLSYSSDDIRKDSIFGYGWSLPLPYIERVNKLGTNNLYNQDKAHTYFTSSLSGELLPMATTTAIGGSVLAESTSTQEFPLIDLLQEFSSAEEPATTTATPETIAPEKLPIVDSNTALSFHTPTTPAFVYHPNEWRDWNKAREEGRKDAKKPIPGFAVAEDVAANLQNFDELNASDTAPVVVPEVPSSETKKELKAVWDKITSYDDSTSIVTYSYETDTIPDVLPGEDLNLRTDTSQTRVRGLSKDGLPLGEVTENGKTFLRKESFFYPGKKFI